MRIIRAGEHIQHIPGYGISVRESGVAVGGALLYDTFTDEDNTLLADHTMDVGPGWTIIQSPFTIFGNRARCGDSPWGLVAADAGQASATARVVTTIPSRSGEVLGLVVWAASQSAFYGIGPIPNSGLFAIRIGVFGTILASTPWVGGTENRIIECVCDASTGTLTATLDGGSEITASGLTPTTYFGMRGRNTIDYFDDFEVSAL